MARITRANKISKNPDGFVNGEIIAIQEAESQYGNQLEWAIGVQTAKGITALMRFWTGTTLNHEKNYFPTEGSKGEYNKLTQICLLLGVVSEELLTSQTAIDIDVSEALEGKKVWFKTKPSEKRRALENVDVSTLRLAS